MSSLLTSGIPLVGGTGIPILGQTNVPILGHQWEPDPEAYMDAAAMAVAASHGFVYSGATPDKSEVYARRFTGHFVDMMSLVTAGGKASACCRYERRGFPWPPGEWPEPGRIVTGSLRDVVRQVLEWPA
ncbi:hypothetical protein [Amycolatopsis sp. GM8]|uniref:hypothetical protein n=1 Tax=Amycolatopsis sp. GM8 TaxID=2896530 RepID=UPI001F191E53|nr:hypothetical protein [Amycolatopsis sp. GM8]